MKIGQTVYLEKYDYRGNRVNNLVECIITKIGKKYFEVSNFRGRFFIDTLRHDAGDYTSKSKIHLSESKFYEEIEIEQKSNTLRKYFRDGYSSLNLSLDKINEILRIIEL